MKLTLHARASRSLLATGIFASAAIATLVQSERALAQDEAGTVTQEDLSYSDLPQQAVPEFAPSRFGLNFSSTVFGPSAGAPARPFQPEVPGPTGPFERPVLLRSVTTLSYALGETTGLRTNFGWDWTPTDTEGHFELKDPQLHFYDASILSNESFNWYGDFRILPGVTAPSRDGGLIAGIQTFHDFTFASARSRWSADAYLSLRWNAFNDSGEGDDIQTFAAPHVAYHFSDQLASSLQIEFSGGHHLGAPGDHFYLETIYAVPGIEYAPTPALALEPYLSIPMNQEASLKSTALGFSLSWDLL